MRTRTLLVAPLAALALIAPLSACSSAPEQLVCAVLESDGDDWTELPDPALCPPPGTPAAARGPAWVPASQIDTDDGGRSAVRTTTAKAKPTSPKATPKSTAATSTRKTTPSRSR